MSNTNNMNSRGSGGGDGGGGGNNRTGGNNRGGSNNEGKGSSNNTGGGGSGGNNRGVGNGGGGDYNDTSGGGRGGHYNNRSGGAGGGGGRRSGGGNSGYNGESGGRGGGHSKEKGNRKNEAENSRQTWIDDKRKMEAGGASTANQSRQNQHNRNTYRQQQQEEHLSDKRQLQQKWQSNPKENLMNKDKKRMQFSPVEFNGTPDTSVLEHLSKCQQRPVPTVTLDQVIKKSYDFWDYFPSDTARMDNLKKEGVSVETLEQHLHSVYPIVHHSTLKLMLNFLRFKQRHGSDVERKLYDGMTLIAFVERLIKQRPMSFLGANDQYYLPAPTFKHGYGGFERIGTSQEVRPLLLEDYLSYDEMRIAALVCISSWSMFVNNGRRKNYGVRDKDGSFQATGVICGQIGCRLKKEGVMEYLDCVVTREENVPEKGFGERNEKHVNSVWSSLWGHHLPTYGEATEISKQQRDATVQPSDGIQFEYMSIGKDLLFNVSVFKMRILITAEVLMCEAATRAAVAGKKAYIHVVGLGLGVWRASKQQDGWFVEAWGDALRSIANTDNIAHIDFSYIDSYSIHGIKNGEKFPKTNIEIHFSNRNLHDKVPDDCILVCNYAWDGNSLPGNEFWLGKMCSTGDSAAACSSAIAEIHNHFINPVVCADSLRVATKEGLLVPWTLYGKKQIPSSAPTLVSANAPLAVQSPPSAHQSPPPVHQSPPPVHQSPPSVHQSPPPVHQSSPSAHQSPPPVHQSPPPVHQSPPSAVQSFSPNAPIPFTVPSHDVYETRIQEQNESSCSIDDKSANSDPVSKKLRKEPTTGASSDSKPEEIPPEIPHPSIPGLMIPNPLCSKPQKNKKKGSSESPPKNSNQKSSKKSGQNNQEKKQGKKCSKK